MCNEMNEKGLKYDAGKPMIALIPWNELLEYGVGYAYQKEIKNSTFPEVGDDEIGEWEDLLAKRVSGVIQGMHKEAEYLGKVFAMLNASMNGNNKDLNIYEVTIGVANVFKFGTLKYGYDNWREFKPTVENYYRFASAAYRHFIEFSKDRYKADDESGILHIYHCVWNLLLLYHFSYMLSK